MRSRILRFSLLFICRGHFNSAKYALGEGMVGHHLGRSWVRLGDESEHGLHCAVYSEGKEAVGRFSGLVLLYVAGVVGSFVLRCILLHRCQSGGILV